MKGFHIRLIILLQRTGNYEMLSKKNIQSNKQTTYSHQRTQTLYMYDAYKFWSEFAGDEDS